MSSLDNSSNRQQVVAAVQRQPRDGGREAFPGVVTHDGGLSALLIERQNDDIETAAFSDAVECLRKRFKGDTGALAWLENITRDPPSPSRALEDLLTTSRQAEEKYDAECTGRRPAMRWIRGLSSRIMHYGRVLDTLSNHHPEYVSLVWGLIKFVLMGVLNHGTMVEQFSQGISMISNVLPITQVNAQLYRTRYMRDAVGRLYGHILLFLRHAVSWYGGSRFNRAVKALFKPFELSFKDTVQQIQQCSQIIDDIANAGMRLDVHSIGVTQSAEAEKTEQRLQRQEVMLMSIQERFDTLAAAVRPVLHTENAAHIPPPQPALESNQQRHHPALVELNLKDVLSAIEPAIPPDEALKKQQSLLQRASPWRRSPGIHDRRLLDDLRRWSSGSHSSVLVLQAHPRSQVRIREVVTVAVSMLRKNKSTPVIWYLSNPGACRAEDGTASSELTKEVIRTLAIQALRLAPDLANVDPGNFNADKLSGSHSEDEWVSLLVVVLERLGQCFVVVEPEDLVTSPGQYRRLVEHFRRLTTDASLSKARIKLLFVSYGQAWDVEDASENAVGMKIVDVKREAAVPPARRKPGGRTAFQNDLRRSIGGVPR